MTEIYCPNCKKQTLALIGDGKIMSLHLTCRACQTYWKLEPNSPQGAKKQPEEVQE